MTTSLSAYLLESNRCSLLVSGIKEPSIFSSDPALAVMLVERETRRRPGQWLLDASVDYVMNPSAVRAIANTVDDYRVIVCLRNRLQRTVSAFAYYKALHVRKACAATLYSYPNSLKFGDAAIRGQWANDPLAPSMLRTESLGRYAFTAINGSVRGLAAGDPRLDAVDDEVERFRSASLPSVILREFRHYRREGSFPQLSILMFSYFTWGLENVLSKLDRARVQVVTLQERTCREALKSRIGEFLGLDDLPTNLPKTNDSGAFGGGVSDHDVLMAENMLRESFKIDAESLSNLFASYSDLNLSLFSSEALRTD